VAADLTTREAPADASPGAPADASQRKPPDADLEPARAGRWSRRVVGPFTPRHLAVLGASVLGVALLVVALETPIAGPAAPTLPVPGSGFWRLSEPTVGLAIGQVAPELETEVDGTVEPLRDLSGDPLSLASRRGRPVWLSFFASWCPPCQEETPVLREAHETWSPRGLEMIAVSVQETTAEDLRAFAQTYELRYPIGFDATSGVFRAYRGFGLPTHLFLDRDGRIRTVYYGPLRLDQVRAIIEPLLSELEAGATVSPTTGD
jgi:peroxiredoxin